MNLGHYTLEEIKSQPQTWRKAMSHITDQHEKIAATLSKPESPEVLFCGAGSSYYLGQSGAAAFFRITGRQSWALPSSELFVFDSPIAHDKSSSFLLVPVSRSGQTTETILAVRRLRKDYRFTCVGLSCYQQSEMNRVSDFTLALECAQEKSVVMTRAFTSMLIGAQAMSYIADSRDPTPLSSLADALEARIDETHELMKSIAKESRFDHYVYLGAGPLYGLAQEGMLKMKEMALENSEAFHPLEFRHGPKAIVTERTLITLLASDSGARYETRLVEDLKGLGANLLVIGDQVSPALSSAADFCLELSSGLAEYDRLPLYVPALQLLGWQVATGKGIDPDRPRNLDQVVSLDE